MSHLYKVRYKIEVGQFTKQDIGEDHGGCDELLVCSYVEGKDGSGSYCWLSTNGGEPFELMSDYRKIRAVGALLKDLSESSALSLFYRLAAEEGFQQIRKAILKS